jgi:hypothetical protein
MLQDIANRLDENNPSERADTDAIITTTGPKCKFRLLNRDVRIPKLLCTSSYISTQGNNSQENSGHSYPACMSATKLDPAKDDRSQDARWPVHTKVIVVMFDDAIIFPFLTRHDPEPPSAGGRVGSRIFWCRLISHAVRHLPLCGSGWRGPSSWTASIRQQSNPFSAQSLPEVGRCWMCRSSLCHTGIPEL